MKYHRYFFYIIIWFNLLIDLNIRGVKRESFKCSWYNFGHDGSLSKICWSQWNQCEFCNQKYCVKKAVGGEQCGRLNMLWHCNSVAIATCFIGISKQPGANFWGWSWNFHTTLSQRILEMYWFYFCLYLFTVQMFYQANDTLKLKILYKKWNFCLTSFVLHLV